VEGDRDRYGHWTEGHTKQALKASLRKTRTGKTDTLQGKEGFVGDRGGMK